MPDLEEIAEKIHQSFEARTAARDQALTRARNLTRHCANAIRAIHRDERSLAQRQIKEALSLVESLRANLLEYPDIYYAGYTQDALKEFAEANLVYALVYDETLPTPEELGLEYSTYLQGLAETTGELRRRILDLLLNGQAQSSVVMMRHMDDIYTVLVSMDYPDAITGGLRRLTDVARGVIERTRGDLTMSLSQEKLQRSLLRFEEKVEKK